VLHPRIVKYLRNVEARHGLAWTFTEGETIAFCPDVVLALPPTARDAVGFAALSCPVSAIRVVAAPIDEDLVFYAYSVEAIETGIAPAETPPPIEVTRVPQPLVRSTRGGARREIINSAQRVMTDPVALPSR
jgi:hypothetical protein